MKSLDERALLESARRWGRVLTIGEQTVLGGAGSAEAEVSEEPTPSELDHVGLPDCFAESGPHMELPAKYSISAGEIVPLERRVVRGVSA